MRANSRRTRLEPIAHVIQHSCQHAPSHSLAELDHARGKAFAGMGQILYASTWNVVLLRHQMYWHLVAEISKLQGGIESSIYPSGVDLIWSCLSKGATMCPGTSSVSTTSTPILSIRSGR